FMGPAAHSTQGPPEQSPRFLRDCSDQSWIEWLAAEDRLQGSQERHALLAQRGAVAPDARERLGARILTQGAGHFLGDLDHAQALLGLVVVKGDGAVGEEGEHRRLVHPEALEQVAWGGLLGATLLLPRWSFRRRIGRQPPGQHLLIARDEGVACGP